MLDQRVHRGGCTHAGPRSEHGKARPRGPTEAYTMRYVVPVREPVPGSRTGSADGDGTPLGEAYGTGIR
jgi:hypothetical protein